MRTILKYFYNKRLKSIRLAIYYVQYLTIQHSRCRWKDPIACQIWNRSKTQLFSKVVRLKCLKNTNSDIYFKSNSIWSVTFLPYITKAGQYGLHFYDQLSPTCFKFANLTAVGIYREQSIIINIILNNIGPQSTKNSSKNSVMIHCKFTFVKGYLIRIVNHLSHTLTHSGILKKCWCLQFK